MLDDFIRAFKRPNWGSVTFAIIMGAMIALTIHDSYLLFLRYMSDPKESDMRIEVNETMPVPDITFCVPSSHAHSHLKGNLSTIHYDELQKYLDRYSSKEEFLGKPIGEKLLQSAYEALSTAHTMEREAFGAFMAKRIRVFGSKDKNFLTPKRINMKFWADFIYKMDISFEELKQKVGGQIIDMMVRGEFQRIIHNRTTETRLPLKTETTWISKEHFCFKAILDAVTGEPVNNQKPFMFLNFFYDPDHIKKEEGIQCALMNVHGDPYDISPYTEHGASSRDGITETLCPGLRYDVTIEVVDSYQMVENDEEGTQCQEFDDDEEVEKTEFECHGICRAELLANICNCSAHTTRSLLEDDYAITRLPHCGDYSQCTVNPQHYESREHKCTEKCLRDCNQVRYNVVSGQTARIIHPLSNGTKAKSNAMTTIFVNWASFEFMTVEQSQVYSYSSFIGELGGVLGLWLGLSILAIVKDSFTAAETVTTKAVGVVRKKSRVNDSNGDRKPSDLRRRGV